MFLAVSLALHAVALAAFYREAPPLASVGERSISVEIVLGTDRAAGLAEKPTVAESTVNSAAAQGMGPELVKPETARAEVEVAEIARDAEPVRAPSLPEAKEVSPTTPPQLQTATEAEVVEAVTAVQVAEAQPVERQPVREAPSADVNVTPATPLLASTAPSAEAAPLVETAPPVDTSTASVATAGPETVSDPPLAETVQVTALPKELALPRPRPEPPRAAEAPRRRQATARRQQRDRGEDARTRESRASAASRASSGIGRGRSDYDNNYIGLVRAQLVRHKHYPPSAKRNGEQGMVIVSFSIEPNGSVSRVTLVRGTGITSLDQEAQASVRRAAPFPPPPSGRRKSYRVPITFDIDIR